jgi:16S rRNA processing protein RimM
LSRDPQRWVALARILRARGNRGEVAAELLTDFPQRLHTMREVYLGYGAGNDEPRAVRLESFWIDRNHPGQAVLHFAGCGAISEAEKLRGLLVLLPIEQRVTLPAGHYFVSELIGCSVFEARQEASTYSSPACSLATAPELLGAVRAVETTGEVVAGTPILVVDTRQGELLIPLAADICRRIDVAARRIDVTLPEGLRSLNSDGTER